MRLVAQELATWPGKQVIADPDQPRRSGWKASGKMPQVEHPSGDEGFTFFALDDEARAQAYAAEVSNGTP